MNARFYVDHALTQDDPQSSLPGLNASHAEPAVSPCSWTIPGPRLRPSVRSSVVQAGP